MKQTKFELLTLHVKASPSSLPWIEAMNQLQRSGQIVAAFPPHLELQEAGFGQRTTSTRELVENHIMFTFKDLQQTKLEFQRVGRELGFPPGSRLAYVTKNAEGEYQFADLLEW
ncbi:MAG: hypothetical protein ACO1TE_22370 [Prosthecobacter sp.]